MKYLLCCLCCLFLLFGGCVPKNGSGNGAGASGENGAVLPGDDTGSSGGQPGPVAGTRNGTSAGGPVDPLEAALSAYLDCTAEAAVDAVLDGASLVQTQLFLADRCNTQKITVLSGMEGEQERAALALRLKEWDLATINAIKDRLSNLEDLLKNFMDCSYSNVRETLTRNYGDVGDSFMENLVDQEIAACYDNSLAEILHPSMGMNSPVGLTRKDRVTLIAKDRIMQELYKEIKRERGEGQPETIPGRNPKGEVVAAL